MSSQSWVCRVASGLRHDVGQGVSHYDKEVLDKLGLPHPAVHLRVQRIATFVRLMSKGHNNIVESLRQSVKHKKSWMHALQMISYGECRLRICLMNLSHQT